VSGFFKRNLDWQDGLELALGPAGYQILGVAFFAALGFLLFRTARKAQPELK
jgi:hypothetical protein